MSEKNQPVAQEASKDADRIAAWLLTQVSGGYSLMNRLYNEPPNAADSVAAGAWIQTVTQHLHCLAAGAEPLAAPHPSQGAECSLCQGRGFYGTPGARCDWCKGTGKTIPTPHQPASAEAGKGVEDVSDEVLCRLADRLWEEGHISDLSKGTAVIYGRAVLALAGSAKQSAALERMARTDDEMGIEP